MNILNFNTVIPFVEPVKIKLMFEIVEFEPHIHRSVLSATIKHEASSDQYDLPGFSLRPNLKICKVDI